jgi:hypothetical protein
VKFTYAPKGQDPVTFDIDTNDLSTDEAEAIDEAGGTQWRTFGGWADLLNNGGWRAWRVALWIALRRTNPELAFEEVRPTVGEIIFEISDESKPDEPAEEPESAEGKSEPGDDDTSSP